MDQINDKCKVITYDEILKLKGNEKNYQDALEASSAFNRRLIKDRKMRIPFLDSQTRVAQTGNSFLVHSYQRKKAENSRHNYVYEYSVRRWHKQQRLIIDPYDPSVFPNTTPLKSQIDENNNNFNSSEQLLLLNHQTASNSSLSQFFKQNENDQDEFQTVNNNTSVVFQDDFFDNEDNDDSEDNDYEETKKKRKRNSRRGKKNENVAAGDEKPFTCDRCGIKYKTKPGLTYHIQKAHTSQASLTHTNSGFLNQNSVKSESMNPDENTNSMLGYDDMNSSSSMHHVQTNSNFVMNLPQNHYQQYNHS
ncbi:unnamed protein product [Brachionus calyciflorus]|uniref:C2H2-type domain-containing protein n=1 Tax=Brachionus calyciflorus TaxID=104777 RepID=A0A814GXT2_9BILA|nr:unnamed protein product [Brachionus calyciflorus]